MSEETHPFVGRALAIGDYKITVTNGVGSSIAVVYATAKNLDRVCKTYKEEGYGMTVEEITSL